MQDTATKARDMKVHLVHLIAILLLLHCGQFGARILIGRELAPWAAVQCLGIRANFVGQRTIKLACGVLWISLMHPLALSCRRTKRWEAHIWDDKKQVYLGGFDIEEHAGPSAAT